MRICVCNAKGGVGKTTTAVHLAVGLAESGRTLLVDTDPQHSALAWAEMSEEFPATVVGLPVKKRLARQIEEFGSDYAHIVIDTPPQDLGIVRAALFAADIAVVPLSPTTLDVDRLRATLELVAEVEASHEIRLLMLLTRARTGTRSARAVRRLLEDELEVPTARVGIPLREEIAMGFGTTPSIDRAYREVLDELEVMA